MKKRHPIFSHNFSFGSRKSIFSKQNINDRSALIHQEIEKKFKQEKWKIHINNLKKENEGSRADLFSNFVVDICYSIYYVLENLKIIIGEAALNVYPRGVKDFVAVVIRDYCTEIEKSCVSEKEFLPGPWPALSLTNRSNCY